MDELKGIRKQMEQSKVQVAELQQKFNEGSISPEEVVTQSINAFKKIGEAIREETKQN